MHLASYYTILIISIYLGITLVFNILSKILEQFINPRKEHNDTTQTTKSNQR